MTNMYVIWTKGTAGDYRETERQRVREKQSEKKKNSRKMVSELPLPLRNVQLLS